MTAQPTYEVTRLPKGRATLAGRRFGVRRDGVMLITVHDRKTAEAIIKALRFAVNIRGQESHLVALWLSKPHVYAIA